MKNFHRLLVSFLFAIGSFQAAFATIVCSPSESASMSAAASYCQGNTATPIQFRYSSCAADGTGARVGTAITIRWYRNTVNSTTGGTLMCTATCTSDTSTTLGTVSHTPSTNTAGMFYYYCVITWSGSDKCNTSGSLTSATTTPITITAPAGAITGANTVCGDATTTFHNCVATGTWSSSNTAVATVDEDGIVTGITPGTAVINYFTGCGTTATRVVTVNSTPSVADIAGTPSGCAGANRSLSNATAWGIWSSDNTGVATVNTGGVVHGVSAGTATISYSVTNSCATTVVTTVFTVGTLPDAGTITGPSTVCLDDNAMVYDDVTDGVWTSRSATKATVEPAVVPGASMAIGSIAGVTTGTTIITYTVSNACGTSYATKAMTVNPLPNAGTVGGTLTLCGATARTLSKTVSGGVWSSDNTDVATVNSAGTVTSINTGTATISYSVTNGCGTAVASKVVTVNPMPVAGTITGSTPICIGSADTLSDSVAGGTWSSSNTARVTVDSNGVITAISAGNAYITYTISQVCGTVRAIAVATVSAFPAIPNLSVTGGLTMCTGATRTITCSTPGAWSAGNPDIATVSSGLITGIGLGTAVISYSVTNVCGTAVATKVFTVNPQPDAGTLSGTFYSCITGGTTLSSTISGGTWSSSTTSKTTIGAITGIATGMAPGTATISYKITNSCGTSIATHVFTVIPTPAVGIITGTASVAIGGSTTLDDAPDNGVWSSSNTGIATIDGGGIVTGHAAGTAVITFNSTNACGTATATKIVTVNAAMRPGTAETTTPEMATSVDIKLFPNPNNAVFSIKCVSGNEINEEIIIEITDMRGNIVYNNNFALANGNLDTQVALGNDIPNGMYILNLRTKTYNKAVTFAVQR